MPRPAAARPGRRGCGGRCRRGRGTGGGTATGSHEDGFFATYAYYFGQMYVAPLSAAADKTTGLVYTGDANASDATYQAALERRHSSCRVSARPSRRSAG